MSPYKIQFKSYKLLIYSDTEQTFPKKHKAKERQTQQGWNQTLQLTLSIWNYHYNGIIWVQQHQGVHTSNSITCGTRSVSLRLAPLMSTVFPSRLLWSRHLQHPGLPTAT